MDAATVLTGSSADPVLQLKKNISTQQLPCKKPPSATLFFLPFLSALPDSNRIADSTYSVHRLRYCKERCRRQLFRIANSVNFNYPGDCLAVHTND